jgi:autonomous glycyl radical cofactor GrcA
MSRPENENPKDRLEKTARELRKHRPRPSDILISRIERLAERSSSKRARPARRRLGRRPKLVFALAAAVAISVAGAIVACELGGSSFGSAHSVNAAQSHRARTLTSPSGYQFGAPSTGGSTTSSLPGAATEYREYVPVPSGKTRATVGAGSTDQTFADTTTVPGTNETLLDKQSSSSAGQITSGNRLAELRAVLTLKVANGDELSRKTAEAMKIARSLSGYVVSTSMDAPSRGAATSYLVLKVPATRSQDALIRISQLGKILSQHVSLEDVKATVTAQGKSIQALKREIASLEQTLSTQTLTPQARSQLQIELARDRARLSSLRTERTKSILRGRLATITLTLTTGDLPKLPSSPSRIHKAIDRAWGGLSSEISWAATGLIVASPFLLLAAAAALLIRARRRSEERRLLEK